MTDIRALAQSSVTAEREACERSLRIIRQRDAAAELIMWLLGERGDFPERPERVEGKPHPLYWWRTELRRRFDDIRRSHPEKPDAAPATNNSALA